MRYKRAGATSCSKTLCAIAGVGGSLLFYKIDQESVTKILLLITNYFNREDVDTIK